MGINWSKILSNASKKINNNQFDSGKYWSAPEQETYRNTKSLVNLPKTNDPNYYNHKNINDYTQQLKENGLDVPVPDVAKPTKKAWWEHITDPISSLQYGLAHGLKNISDDDDNTKFLEGVGKGIVSGVSGNNNLEDRTSYNEVLQTLMNSKNRGKNITGSVLNNTFSLEKIKEHLESFGKGLGSTGLEPRVPEGVKAIYNEATGNTKEVDKFLEKSKNEASLSGLVGDVLLDPANLLNGVLKAPGAMIKGTKALDIADTVNDVTKATDALNAVGKASELKDAQYLIRKTQKLLGSSPDYKGIGLELLGKEKVLVSQKALAKFGDFTKLSKIGEGIRAFENTSAGKQLTNLFRFGKNKDWIIAARQNPEDALKYIAQTEGLSELIHKRLTRKANVLEETMNVQKNVSKDVQEGMTNNLEGEGIPVTMKATVTEKEVNPDYIKVMNQSKSKIAYQIRQLNSQKKGLEKQLASIDLSKATEDTIAEVASLKAQLAQSTQDITMLDNLKSTVDIAYEKHLNSVGIRITDDVEFFKDPMEVATRTIDEVDEMVREAGLKGITDKNRHQFAVKLKQSADNFIDNINKTYPELQYLYTSQESVDDLMTGLAKDVDINEQIKTLANEAKYDISKYPFETATEQQKQGMIRKLEGMTGKKTPSIETKPIVENPIQKIAKKTAPKNVDTKGLDDYITRTAKNLEYDLPEDYIKTATYEQKLAMRKKLYDTFKSNGKPLTESQINLLSMHVGQSGISMSKEEIKQLGYHKFQQLLDSAKSGELKKRVKEARRINTEYTENTRMTFSELLAYEKSVKSGKVPSLKTKLSFGKGEMVDGKEIDKIKQLFDDAKEYGVEIPKEIDTAIIQRFNSNDYVSIDEVAELKRGINESGVRDLVQEAKTLAQEAKANKITDKMNNLLNVHLGKLRKDNPELWKKTTAWIQKHPAKTRIEWEDYLNRVKSHLSEKSLDELKNYKKETPLTKLTNNIEGTQNSPIASIMNFKNKAGQVVGIDEKVAPKRASGVLKAYDTLPKELTNANKKLNIVKDNSNVLHGVNGANSTTILDNKALNSKNVKETLIHESTHAVDRNMSKGVTLVNKERTTLFNTMKKELSKNSDFSDILKETDGATANVSRAESIARFGETLLGNDLAKAQKLREASPKATQAYYDFIAKTPVEDIMNEIELPKTSPVRLELETNIIKTKETLNTLTKVVEDMKKADTIKNVLGKIEGRVKDYEAKLLDADYLKKANASEFKNIPEFVEVEKEVYKIFNSSYELSEKEQAIQDMIKNNFKQWANEEGIQEVENYVTHLLNWDLKNNKKANKMFDNVFDPFNTYDRHRKMEGTIKKINADMAVKYEKELKGKPFFETLISRIYMERGMYHADYMFDKDYADQTLSLFGKRMDKEYFQSLPKNQRAKYWEEVNKLANDKNNVIIKVNEKYEPVTVKTVDNPEIEQGYVRRNQTRETARLVETDNPLIQQLNNMQVNNPYIEIDPKQIKEEEFFTKNAQVYVMPKDAYNAYINTMKEQFNKKRGAFTKLFDKFMSTWKSGAIMSPGFHQTNFIGNTFNSYLEVGAKILDPELNAVAGALQTNKVKGSFNGKSFDEWRNILQRYGMRDVTFFSDNMTEFRHGELDTLIKEQQSKGSRIKNILNQVANPTSDKFIPRKVNTKVGSTIETQARIVNFLAHVQNGKTYDEAADLVNKVLFDYQDLTPFEHNVMKRVFPFYTWVRKNTPLQIDKFLENPTKYSHIANTMRNVQAPETEEQKRNRPEYLKNALHIGDGVYKNLKLPFQDLTKVTEPSDILSSSNPLIKMAVELGMNKNSFTGQTINEGYGVKAPGLMKTLGYETPKGTLMNPTLKHLLQGLMPGTNRFNDLLQSLSSDATQAEKDKANRTFNPKHLQEFKVDINKQKQNAMYDYLEKLKKEVEKAKKEGRIK